MDNLKESYLKRMHTVLGDYRLDQAVKKSREIKASAETLDEHKEYIMKAFQ